MLVVLHLGFNASKQIGQGEDRESRVSVQTGRETCPHQEKSLLSLSVSGLVTVEPRVLWARVPGFFGVVR